MHTTTIGKKGRGQAVSRRVRKKILTLPSLAHFFLETAKLLDAAPLPIHWVCIDDDAFRRTGWGGEGETVKVAPHQSA